ncbi:MAG TPA: hypothetical protein VN063_04830 [Methylophilaceae bacterium]|nr:hypothetical protein [Methylophilaceae bacterium]
MNNLEKPLLKLDGLDIPDLYLADVARVYEHADRRGYRYLTIFMIDSVQLAVPATEHNISLILHGGHHIFEYNLANSLLVQEETPASQAFHQQVNAW